MPREQAPVPGKTASPSVNRAAAAEELRARADAFPGTADVVRIYGEYAETMRSVSAYFAAPVPTSTATADTGL